MPHIQIAAEKIFTIWILPVTNTLLMSWVVVLFLIVIAQIMKRRMQLVPTGIQNVVEMGSESLLNFMEGIFHSRAKAEKYFPLIATVFIVILMSNWMGILPGIGSVGFFEMHHGEQAFVPLLRTVASDLNFTLALAITVVLSVNVIGATAVGFKGHASKYFSFKSPVSFFVGLLELLGEFSRAISFAFRLFGNIFAGEVLLIIMGFLAPFIAPVPFLGLELFVGFIQALVFAMLSMVFISIAIEHHT
jgi:F-type H+-transporting ATPase subunit a